MSPLRFSKTAGVSMASLKEYWSMTEGVFFCLFDTKRTLAFKRAIKKAVRPGDIGCAKDWAVFTMQLCRRAAQRDVSLVIARLHR